ncbi:unnamed protein product [Lactuca saligna]|uniref:Uncharacterized protein n=1 Tax=Lactuca saligna TaxID=75948 RepID=A0AA35YPM1_LACSI|nr:unnamed protein product [Lactuca saligna]
MKSKHKRRSSSTKDVRKPQVSRQGVIFNEIPTPASPSSKKRFAADMEKYLSKKKKRLAADMAKQLSKKKKRRVIHTSESHVDTSVITPPITFYHSFSFTIN